MSGSEPSLNRQRHRGQAGIGLAETLVALALFAIGIVAVGGFLSMHIRMSSSNALSTIAYGLAEVQMENLRTADYSSIASHTSTQRQGAVTFTVTTQVTPDVPAPNMKSIAIDVTWQEPTGPRDVSLHTIYTQVTR
jgi:Tfp pilus assembly protein PilV